MGEQLQAREVDGRWLSPAEQLGVLLFAAAWRREHGALPAEAPVRPLLGPDGPPVQAEPREVECPALLDAAVAISPAVDQAGRFPASVRVGGGLVGPAVLLRALGRALADAPERLRLAGPEELPELARRADFAGLHFQGTWSIFAPEFEAPGLAQLARLPTWSTRPAS